MDQESVIKADIQGEDTLSSETKIEVKTDIPEMAQERAKDDLLQLLEINNTDLLEIKTLIQDRLVYDEVKEKAFDRLYKEMKNQQGLPSLIDKSVKPILTDLILFYDSMKRFKRFLAELEEFNKEELAGQFDYLMDEVLEILYRQDVIPIEQEGVEKYDKKLHRAIKTIPTEQQEDDFRIMDILRTGFLWREQLMRPMEVIIKRYSKKEVFLS